MEALKPTLPSEMCGASVPGFGDVQASNQLLGGLASNAPLVGMTPAVTTTTTTTTEEGRPTSSTAVSKTMQVDVPVATQVKQDVDVATVPDIGSVVEKKPLPPDMKRESGETNEPCYSGPVQNEVVPPPCDKGAAQQVVYNVSLTADTNQNQNKTVAAAPLLYATEGGNLSTGEEGGGCNGGASTATPAGQVQVLDKAYMGQASGEATAATYGIYPSRSLSSGYPDCDMKGALVPSPTMTSNAIPPANSSPGVALSGTPSVVNVQAGGLGPTVESAAPREAVANAPTAVEGVGGMQGTWFSGAEPQEGAAVAVAKYSVHTPPLTEPMPVAETDHYVTTSAPFLPADTVVAASMPGAGGQPAYTACSATESTTPPVMPLKYVAQRANLTPNHDGSSLVPPSSTPSPRMAAQIPPASVAVTPLNSSMPYPITSGAPLRMGLPGAPSMVQFSSQGISLPPNPVMGHGQPPQMPVPSNNHQSGSLMHHMHDPSIPVVASSPIDPSGIHSRSSNAPLPGVTNIALSNQAAKSVSSLSANPNPMMMPVVVQMPPHMCMDQPPSRQPMTQQQQQQVARQHQQQAQKRQQQAQARRAQQQAQQRHQQQQHQHQQQQQQQHQRQQQVQAAQAMGQERSQNGSMAGWQRAHDLPHRKRILQEVVSSLRKCCEGNESESDWRGRVPDMARKLEQRLYHGAASFSEYNDISTISSRLRALAQHFQRGINRRAVPGSFPAQQQQQPGQQSVTTVVPGCVQRNEPGGRRAPPMNSVRSMDAKAAVSQIEGCGPAAIRSPAMGGNQGMSSRKVVNLNDINPIMAGSMQQQQQKRQKNEGSRSSRRENGDSHGMGQLQQSTQQQQLPSSPQLPQNLQHMPKAVSLQEEARFIKQNHQRQKLLMLHHASKCKEEKSCAWAPHCTSMKRLWQHIAYCASDVCKQPHCVSSRLVLSHFKRCEDTGCTVCVPVRRFIEAYNSSNGGHRSSPQQQHQNHLRESPVISQQPPSGKKKPVTVRSPAVQLKQELMHTTRPSYQQHQKHEALDANSTHRFPQTQMDVRPSSGKSQKRPLPSANTNGAPLVAHGGMALSPTDLRSAKRNKYTEETGGIKGGRTLGFTGSSVNFQDATAVTGQNSVGLSRMKQENGFMGRENSSPSSSNMNMPGSNPGRLRKAEECTSLVEAFSSDQIVQHLKSLHTGLRLTANRIKMYVMPLIKGLIEDCQFGWIFSEPVDPVQLNLPDYFDIIRNPMDLGTIRNGINNLRYRTLDDVATDVRLVFDNATTYNQPGSDVYPVAKEMLQGFEAQWENLLQVVQADEESSKLNGEACSLCGFEKLNFEPIAFYCNGENCNGNKIRRQQFYYSGGSNQYHWCQQCYNDLKDNTPIPVGGMLVKKDELSRKKNDEVHEEPWVECGCCKRWVHQVCALFNGRQHTDEKMNYYCPKCILARRQRIGQLGPTAYKLGGDNLKPTVVSEFIEAKVMEKLNIVYAEEARLKGCDISEVPKANKIFIRQVSSQQVFHAVKPNFIRRYRTSGFPEEFPARSRCILLFQEIDGVNVLLFGMYVYEYGHKCPQPNQRRVYISYLDSVFYFRAHQYRTIVYKEIIIAYLEYAKRKGFHTAHIWTCPPLKGDDYILNCHPEAQRTPKVERLQQWYMTMLEDAKIRGVVSSITDIYSEFWEDPNADPTVVPYLEGDYWIGEAENIVKDLEEGGVSAVAPSTSTSKNKSKSKTKSKGGQGAGGHGRDGDGASRQRTHRDPVMRKIGEVIQPMKSSFLVAHLRDKEFVIECKERRKREMAIEEAKEKVKSQNEMPDAACLALSNEEIAENETEMDEEQMDCEMLDTRQVFLNLCQGNHYQFDQMRRAKHSSMMVLYHLCNPDAPKFLLACSKCFKDINTGNRFHCNTCGDFDLCQDCYLRVGAQHDHPLKPIAIWSNQTVIDEEKTKRAKQQKQMALQIQLLEHASDCTNPNCSFLSSGSSASKCKKMKEYFNHAATCMKSVRGGCTLCRQIALLVRLHSRGCKRENCKVPRCKELHAYVRKLATQQQQMDNRRRQAMNESFRARQDAAPASGGPAAASTSHTPG
eukprot:76537_1